MGLVMEMGGENLKKKKIVAYLCRGLSLTSFSPLVTAQYSTKVDAY